VNEKLQKVMQKVAQLRALAAKAGTQAEAETAAAQAEALIAKYQIDEATIKTEEIEEAISEAEPLWAGPRNDQWRGVLCMALCRDHGCGVVAQKTSKQTVYRIAGRPSDVDIVRYMFAWLTVEIERLAQRENGRADRNAFKNGAVAGVILVMRASRAEEVKAAPQGASASLVLVSRYEDAMAHIKSKMSGTFRATPVRAVGRDAYYRGRAAGEGLAPHHALSAGGAKLLGR
jgi:hypothetical protein